MTSSITNTNECHYCLQVAVQPPPLSPTPPNSHNHFSIDNATALPPSGDNTPLDLEHSEYLAMDWKTDASSPTDVVCLIKNKEVSRGEGGGFRYWLGQVLI